MKAAATAQPLTGARILEIGGGIGTIQAELLAAGAAHGEIVELVPAYEPYAQELARAKGIEDRSTFRVADVLEHPESVAAADVVVLNRVVCCSPEGVRLTAVAARLAERLILLSYPRNRLGVRLSMRATNGFLRMMGRSFRVFLHARSSLYEAAQNEGFVAGETRRSFVWEFTAFRRVTHISH